MSVYGEGVEVYSDPMSNRTPEPERLKSEILDLGFDRVGFAPAVESPGWEQFVAWLASGHAGGMDWLTRHAELRRDPRLLLPEARSVIMILLNYHRGDEHPEPPVPSGQGRISRYALGRDYHKVIRRMLRDLDTLLRERWGARHTRICVDSAPLLERSFARRAGLGWIGRNTMLIDQRLGSWTFLGALLCDLDLPGDDPVTDRCGECRACLEACPTGALSDEGLDARRCISYLTIEHRGEIPEHLTSPMGSWVFGCDICQEVCPWNRKAPVSEIADFKPRPELINPSLSELLTLDQAGFLNRFAGTPVMRAGLERLQRNVKIASRNQSSADGEPDPTR